MILDRLPGGVLLVHGACPRGADAIADADATRTPGYRIEAHPADWRRYGRAAGHRRKRRDDRTRRGWLCRIRPRRQSRQYQCRPTGQGSGHIRLASHPALTDSDSSLACPGAMLGATPMNDLIVLRTDVNNGKRQAQGSGLI
jgi:hypothetical protein